ncbi:MAG: bifunctional folylpolyglutamate synthase/dihydrofolate synthase [Xanthomonadales bacterium]|nr:bifunctional folylpolyglutamate synthase/dihydrofolate synthase [Xanthomonadales bacterium]
MKQTLEAWLGALEQRGPAPIALGLDRVSTVYRALCDQRAADRAAPLVFVVAGTNGKGSTVAYLDSILRASGMRCGRYTSPHLIRFAERIVVNGVQVDDALIVDAFERIEQARGEIDLTYFEFATLAALEIFADAALDAWVLEVGLGGRLDAVNIIDANVAVITSVDLDHQHFLGDTREAIGAEKAGIIRRARPLVVGDRQPPQSVIAHAEAEGAPCFRLGQDFDAKPTAEHPGQVRWHAPDHQNWLLSAPPLLGEHQIDNLATALAALWCVRGRWPWALDSLQTGIKQTRLSGRLQRIPAHCACYVDVAHNPDSARALARWLQAERRPGRRIRAVFSLLSDKALDQVLRPLLPLIDGWSVAGLEGPRGRPAADLVSAISAGSKASVQSYASVQSAFSATLAQSAADDLVIAFGSFAVAEAVLRLPPTASD